MSKPPHRRLEDAMKARRLELRMSWTDIAKAAAISPQALRSIRRGEYRPSALTARALDDALGWPEGTVDRILDGEDAPEQTSPMDQAERDLDEAERIVEQLRALPAHDRQTVAALIETLQNLASDPDRRRADRT